MATQAHIRDWPEREVTVTITMPSNLSLTEIADEWLGFLGVKMNQTQWDKCEDFSVAVEGDGGARVTQSMSNHDAGEPPEAC